MTKAKIDSTSNNNNTSSSSESINSTESLSWCNEDDLFEKSSWISKEPCLISNNKINDDLSPYDEDEKIMLEKEIGIPRSIKEIFILSSESKKIVKKERERPILKEECADTVNELLSDYFDNPITDNTPKDVIETLMRLRWWDNEGKEKAQLVFDQYEHNFEKK